MVRKIVKICLVIVAVLVLIVGSYAIYLFASYNRIEDNLALEIDNKNTRRPATGTEYSILSWNIGFAAYSSDYSFFMDGGKRSRALSKQAVYDNLSGILNTVTHDSSDIVLLQEVDLYGTRSYHVNEKDYICNADLMKNYSTSYALNYNSAYIMYPLLSPHGANQSGILSMFGFNAKSSLRRSLPVDKGVSKIVDLDRCYSVTRIPCENGKELCVYNVHLSAYTSNSSIITNQWKMLADDMKSEYEKGNYVISGGDYNTDLLVDSSKYFKTDSAQEHSWSKPLPVELIPNGFNVVASSNAPSCRNADEPYNEKTTFVLTVDGFIVSNNVTVVSSETIDQKFEHSDHNPVKMKFVLK